MYYLIIICLIIFIFTITLYSIKNKKSIEKISHEYDFALNCKMRFLSKSKKILLNNNLKGLSYELQIADYFKDKGYKVENRYMLSHDGGIDVIARKGSEIILIQCKNYISDNKITTELIKKFIGDCYVYLTQKNLHNKNIKIQLRFICSCNINNELVTNYVNFAKNKHLDILLETQKFFGIKDTYKSILLEHIIKKF